MKEEGSRGSPYPCLPDNCSFSDNLEDNQTHFSDYRSLKAVFLFGKPNSGGVFLPERQVLPLHCSPGTEGAASQALQREMEEGKH